MLRITPTTEHLERGWTETPDLCPYALALRAYLNVPVLIFRDSFYIGGTLYSVSESVGDWLKEFDDGGDIRDLPYPPPFELTREVFNRLQNPDRRTWDEVGEYYQDHITIDDHYWFIAKSDGRIYQRNPDSTLSLTDSLAMAIDMSCSKVRMEMEAVGLGDHICRWEPDGSFVRKEMINGTL